MQRYLPCLLVRNGYPTSSCRLIRTHLMQGQSLFLVGGSHSSWFDVIVEIIFLHNAIPRELQGYIKIKGSLM